MFWTSWGVFGVLSRTKCLSGGYNVDLEALLQQGVSEPEFCGDLVCGFGKIMGRSDFSRQFGELLTVMEGLAVAWMLCGGLRAWLSASSLLVAVLRSLVARRRFGPWARWRPLRKTLASGLGLGDMSLAWSAAVQLLVFIYSGMHWGWPRILVFVCCSD